MSRRRSALFAAAGLALAAVPALRQRPWTRIGVLGGEGLAERVRDALAKQSHIPDYAIRVSAAEGVVTLEGELGSPYTQASIDAAEAAAQGVRGVVRVENRLRLGSMTPEQLDDLR
jgi:osmotically-inducible protein OsmY